MKYTSEQIKEMVHKASSNAGAIAELHGIIGEEIKHYMWSRRITRRALRESLTMRCEELGEQYNTAHALVTMEATAAALGYTIVDDKPEENPWYWRPAREAPPLVECLLTYDTNPGSLIRGVKQFALGGTIWCNKGRAIVPQPDRYWTGPVPPLPVPEEK